MANQLLLLTDVDNLGRSGDLVKVKPGYARNFLLPQKLAVVADKSTLRMRSRLQEERAKRAIEDRADSEVLATKINGKHMQIGVKIDPEGNMYGSVSAVDIVKLFDKESISLEKRNVVLAHPIKTLGAHTISLKLKEDVSASFTLEVLSEEDYSKAQTQE